MTTAEFSNEFDILYNNVTSNLAPGLSEYEKSVFLTRAQEELVLSYYNGNNVSRISFEETEEVRKYLNSLIRSSKMTTPVTDASLVPLTSISKFYTLPSNTWFITYEEAKLTDDNLPYGTSVMVDVVPTTQDSYSKKTKNPFTNNNTRRIFRLDTFNTTNNSLVVELLSSYNIEYYNIKYLVLPSPIILINLEGGATINGVAVKTECVLHKTLHTKILDIAVNMAKKVYDSQEK